MTFTILIMVFMLAQYLSTTFPATMEDQEFQHTLQVEDQFETLQSNVLLQVANPSREIPVTTPISLSGSGAPPFGPPAPSTLAPSVPNEDNITLNYTTTEGSGTSPTWNISNFCGVGANWYQTCNFGGSNNCGASSAYINYNLSYEDLEGNHWQIGGSSDCVFLNISGSHNDIYLQMGGSHEGGVVIVVQGNYNFLDVDLGGSAIYGENVWMFGQHNVYNLTAGGSNLDVNTYFVGFNPSMPTCPYQNTSNTDSFNIVSAGGTNILQNLTWYDLVGWSTAYHQTGMPGGGASDHLGWSNISASISCAFGSSTVVTYPEHDVAGLLDTLDNQYLPHATFDYEEGAVVEGQASGAVMVSGPDLTYTPMPSGYAVSLTLVQFIPKNLTTEAGYGTVGIQTWLISETTEKTSGGGMFLSVTTPYASAWKEWVAANPAVFPNAPILSSCYFLPGSLQVCTLNIWMVWASLSLTQAVVGISYVG